MNKQELKRLCKGLKVKETGMYTKGYNIGINAVLSTLLSVGNPPLKFEELHDGMWVWDNRIKAYLKIQEIWVNKVIHFDNCCVVCFFQENRFFRYEVENDAK